MKNKIINLTVTMLLVTSPALANPPTTSETAATGREGQTGLSHQAEKLAKRLRLSGLIEVEASAGRDFAEKKASAFSLATVELGLDARITESVAARLLGLYEEGAEDDHLIIDEGTITLGNVEKSPFQLTTGRMYLPFGSFASAMVSDPLTLELAEIRENAMLAGFARRGWQGSLYLYNGEVDETGGDDAISSFGASLDYCLEQPGWQIDLGAGWLNNLGDSDSIQDHLAGTSITVADLTEAVSLHGRLRRNGWSAMTELVAALDAFAPGELDFAGRGARPMAWQLELAYTTKMAEREVILAIGYQGTDEAVALGLPRHRFLVSIGACLFEKTALTLEYRHDQDYDPDAGGTGVNAYQAMVQLAVEL